MKSVRFYLIKLILIVLFFPSLAQEKQQASFPPDAVKSLKAYLVPGTNSIHLEWSPPSESGQIIVARSNERIDTPQKLYISDSLGKYKSDPLSNPYTSHNDVNLKPGKYYFAVVLAHKVKKQNVVLIPGENYTLEPIIVPDPQESKESGQAPTTNKTEKEIPENLKNSVSHFNILEISSRIRLDWEPPMEAEDGKTGYVVYMSEKPLSELKNFKNAKMIKRLKHPVSDYLLPKELKIEKEVFFGVSVVRGSKEKIPLEEGISFAKYIPEKQTLPNVEPQKEKIENNTKSPEPPVPNTLKMTVNSIRDLTYEVRKDGLLLLWNPPHGASEDTTVYTIYESETPLEGEYNPIVRSTAHRIATIYHPDSIFFYPKYSKNFSNYIGITVKEKDKEENPYLIENVSFIKIDPKIIVEKQAQLEKASVQKACIEPIKDEPKENQKIEPKKEEVKESKKIEPEKEIPKKELVKVDESHKKKNPIENSTGSEEEVEDTSGKEEPVRKKDPLKKEVKPSKVDSDEIEIQAILDSTYKQKHYKKAISELKGFLDRTENSEKIAKAWFYIALSYFRMEDYDTCLRILQKKDIMRNYDKERVDFYIQRCIEYTGKDTE